MLQCLEITTETKASMETETKAEATAKVEETLVENMITTRNTTVERYMLQKRKEGTDLKVEIL